MRPLILLICILISQLGLAQHSTLRFFDEPFGLDQQSILVVPFEEKMYLSDVNSEIAKANQLSTAQIISRFSNAMDQSIYYAFKDRCQVTNFRNFDDDSASSDLTYVYQNVDLEYVLVKKEVKTKGGIQSLTKKFSKKDKASDKYDRGGLSDGQVVTKSDERERYMKAVVNDQAMLDSMNQRFGNNFILFLNELDFKNDYTDALAMQRMEYQRELKVHFTLYNKEGELLATGVSRTMVPSTENNINEITSKYFPILAKNIFEALFPAEDEETSEAKVKLQWK
ncbi:MAG: hypothetical protein CMP59_03730 [Flavobacteriales bacterium]|nr:hypothetical protein [Flavobacteriales bacterium]